MLVALHIISFVLTVILRNWHYLYFMDEEVEIQKLRTCPKPPNFVSDHLGPNTYYIQFSLKDFRKITILLVHVKIGLIFLNCKFK